MLSRGGVDATIGTAFQPHLPLMLHQIGNRADLDRAKRQSPTVGNSLVDNRGRQAARSFVPNRAGCGGLALRMQSAHSHGDEKGHAHAHSHSHDNSQECVGDNIAKTAETALEKHGHEHEHAHEPVAAVGHVHDESCSHEHGHEVSQTRLIVVSHLCEF